MVVQLQQTRKQDIAIHFLQTAFFFLSFKGVCISA
jgi:hypothetical protein